MTDAGIEITGVDVHDILDPHEFVWGEEFYYCGALEDGRYVSLFDGPMASGRWQLPSEASAQEHMRRTLIESMHCGPEPDDITFEWPRTGVDAQHFVGTRTDQDRYFTIVRIGDRCEVDEYEVPHAALAAALDAAEDLVEFVVAQEDEPDAQLIEAFLMHEITRVRLGMWSQTAARRVQDSQYEDGFGTAEPSERALAERLGLPEQLVAETLR
jgi:hypothetical protein